MKHAEHRNTRSLQNYKVKACTSHCCRLLIFALMRSNEGSPHQLVFAQHVRVSFLLLWNRETRRLTYPRNKLSQQIGHSNKIHDTQIADGNNPVVARWGLFFRLFSQKHHHLGVWSFTDLADMETLWHVMSHFLSPTQCSVKMLSS